MPVLQEGNHNPAMALDTDEQRLIALIGRIAAHDAEHGGTAKADAERALRELYDCTAPKLYGLALRVVGSADQAEDVLQIVFLNIWRNAGNYRVSLSPPMAWLCLLVRSRALDALRRRASERADLHSELNDTMAESVADDSPNPMDTTQASEQAWALHECLRKLEGRQREVISMAYLHDLSHRELAEQLRLPLGTVKTWIRRGLDLLRGCMAHYA